MAGTTQECLEDQSCGVMHAEVLLAEAESVATLLACVMKVLDTVVAGGTRNSCTCHEPSQQGQLWSTVLLMIILPAEAT